MEKPAYQATLIDAASASNTAGTVGEGVGAQLREAAFNIAWGTSVSAGVVKIEAAPTAAYTGTWATLATVTYVSGSPLVDIVQVSGCAGAYRARISTAISGGTVTVTFVGN
jgi:hypothetical protein